MSQIVFDTLEFSKVLKKGGVEYADIHATALAGVLVHNIYTKCEVDNMIDAALKEFRESTRQMNEGFHDRTRQMHAETLEIEKQLRAESNKQDKQFNERMHQLRVKSHERIQKMRDQSIQQDKQSRAESSKVVQELKDQMARLHLEIERSASRTIHTTVGIIGSLITVFGLVATFVHLFSR